MSNKTKTKKATILTESNIETIDKLNSIRDNLEDFFVERDEIIEIMFLALLSRNHVIMIGPPGTAKSYLITCFNGHFEGFRLFTHQLTKYTLPEEVFGQYSLSKLKDDKLERIKHGKLQDCEIAFIDEVFNANSSILNSFNQVMNERTFDHEPIDLISMFAATNFQPEEPVLVAFFDRFLFKIFIDEINDKENFIHMLKSKNFDIKIRVSRDEFEELRSKLPGIKMNGKIEKLAEIWELLRVNNIRCSSRRYKWSLNALKARALMNKRDHVISEDLIILKNILWNEKTDINELERTLYKSIDPVAHKVKELLDMASELEKQARSKDPRNHNDLVEIQEIKDKLMKIMEELKKIKKQKNISVNLQKSITKCIKSVRNKYMKVMKDKLGIDFYADFEKIKGE